MANGSWETRRLYQPPRQAAIRGKFEVAIDRIATYVDVAAREPTPRMLEAVYASLADGINYTVEGVLFVMGRQSSQYRGAPAALAAAYPTVAAAGKAMPAEATLRQIITRVPPEADLREVIERRNASVHQYANVRYVSPADVYQAFVDARSFYAAAVAMLTNVGDLAIIGAQLEAALMAMQQPGAPESPA